MTNALAVEIMRNVHHHKQGVMFIIKKQEGMPIANNKEECLSPKTWMNVHHQ